MGFVVDKVALGWVFLRVLQFPCQYHSTVAVHIHIAIIWGMNNRPAGGRSSQQSHTIDKQVIIKVIKSRRMR
jgi:hypothetical protein